MGKKKLDVFTPVLAGLSDMSGFGVANMIRDDNKKLNDAIKGDMPGSDIATLLRSENQKISTLLKDSVVSTPQLTQEQMFSKCFEIGENAEKGKVGNVEFNFLSKEQISNGESISMDRVWLKAKNAGSSSAESISISDKDEVKAIVFVGGNDTTQAFLATQDTEGKENVSELEEFHTLVVDTTKPNSESGLLTSFKGGVMHTGIIGGMPNLDPVKHLLMSNINEKTELFQKLTGVRGGANNNE